MRELEKQAVMDASAEQSSKHRHDSTVDVPLPMYMMRSVACFTGQSVAFVDTHQPLWQMLHCNMAFSEVMPRLVTQYLAYRKNLGCCCYHVTMNALDPKWEESVDTG